jgi:predicted amidohydrolase
MHDLRVTLIQTALFWEEAKKNLDHFDNLISRIVEPTDLILLPETFNTGFSINPDKCAEPPDGPSFQFLHRKAREKNAVIMATLMVSEGDGCYNRLICMRPDGTFETYDKRHLFRLSDENKVLTAGKAKLLVEVKGWMVSTVTCYDLRFPVWCKNTWSNGKYEYDLLVCLANWPSSRSDVWKTLLRARAMENQAYVAAVNRIGSDGNGYAHSGDSMAIDAKGQICYIAPEGLEEVRTVEFSAAELEYFRNSYTLGKDWDHFTIHVSHDQPDQEKKQFTTGI